MKKIVILISLIVSIVTEGCSNRNVSLDENKFITCDYRQVHDTIDMSLSQLIESLDVILLDDSQQDAIINVDKIQISENYLGITSYDPNLYKLYDRKNGKYIQQIGAKGRGPNEYNNIYHTELDESKDRIYITQFPTDKIWVYTLRNQHLPPIRLAYRLTKGAFYLDEKNNEITLLNLPFKGDSAIAWVQDFSGKVKHKIDSKPYAIRPDFSNELISLNNCKSSTYFDYHILTFWDIDRTPDTLYHYNKTMNKLEPRFTIVDSEKARIHSFIEIPKYFCTQFTVLGKGNLGTQGVDTYWLMVDKQTEEAHYVRFKNDFLGGIKIINGTLCLFDRGYFIYNIQPEELEEQLDEALTNGTVTDKAVLDKLKSLKKNIAGHNNAVIMYGNLKQ